MIAQAVGFSASELMIRIAAWASPVNSATKRSPCPWVSQNRLPTT
jgi:hypothetical protein